MGFRNPQKFGCGVRVGAKNPFTHLPKQVGPLLYLYLWLTIEL